ncbi:MAG: domain S-box protein [Gammaproteobacteria bacterium]|jgi:CheY-like chemotaxis protein|nr:domain S-box protein [Gammaproteobacteria bacterium]
MLSADKINIPIPFTLNEQDMRHREEAGLEAKNDFLEQAVAFSHAMHASLHVLGECMAGLQTFSERCDEEKISVSTHRDLFMPLRILIVDDMPVNQRILRRILGKQHDCEFASNGKEAVEKYSENTFDIIFMDIQMPLMDGLEATTTIRQQELANSKRRTPIIASTAIGSSALDTGITVAAGMDGYIMKPYDAKRVREIIHLYTGNGEKSSLESEGGRDEKLPTSTFPPRKISRTGFLGRRASSPALLTSTVAHSLVVSPRLEGSESDPSCLEQISAKNPEGLSSSPWHIPSGGHRLLASFHLLRYENRSNLAQGPLLRSDVKWRQSPLRKSF